MKEIPLTHGKVALVDDQDYEWLNEFSWCAISRPNGICYATMGVRVYARMVQIPMHRAIMLPKRGLVIDHIDCDGLNNQRSNLRLATPAQNSRNRRITGKNTSGFKGVRWYRNEWIAKIGHEGRTIYLGAYRFPEDAHRAYCEAAIKLHGQFARFE